MGDHNFKEETGENQYDASGFLRVNVSAGSAAGTEYTEDAVAAANPVGTATNLIRQDTPTDEVNANGDNISLRGTKYGAAYAQIVSSAGAFVDTFGGGTQYTEDAVAAADPVGTTPVFTRRDTPAALVSLNLDVVSQQATNYGAAYVQVVSSAGAFVDTFGGGTQYTEDVASVADPVGNQLITRRRDALATETNLDGDNVALNSTNKGELYVKQTDVVPVNDNAGSLTVDAPVATPVFVRLSDGAAAITTLPVSAASLPLPAGASTLAEQQTQTTALQKIDNLAHAGADVALVEHIPVSGQFDDVATTAVTENNIAPVRITSARALHTSVRDALPAGTNNIGDVDVLTVNGVAPAFGTGVRGVTVQRVTIATDDSVPVTGPLTDAQLRATPVPVSGTVAVTGVSTLAEQQTQTTALQLIDDAVYASDGVLNKSIAMGAVFDDVATVAITENQAGYVRMSSRRALLVEGVASGTALNVLDTNSAAALTSLQLIDNAVSGLGFNITQQGGVAVSLNTGVRDAGTQRVTIATNDSVPVTFTGSTDVATQTTLASLLTSSQLIDDAVYASDGVLNKSIAMGAVFDDVASVAITENQAGYLRMSSRRALLIEGVASGTVVPVSDGAGSLTVDNAGTFAVQIAANSSVNVAQINGVTPLMGNGVTGTGSHRVTIASDNTAFAVNATLSAETVKVIGTINIAAAQTLATVTTVASVTQNPDIRQATAANLNAQVVGNVAHDVVDSGNPVKVGFRAVSHGATPTAVAAADRTDWLSNIHGIPFIMGGHPNVVTLRLNSTAANTDQAVVTVAAGTKIVVTRCSVTLANSTTVDVQVRIGFGAVNTPTTTGVLLSHPGVAPGSGVVEGIGAGILGIGADDEDVRVTSTVPTTGSMDIVLSYYLIAS